jgi:hypothetical protein
MRGSVISSWMLLQHALASVRHSLPRDSVDTKEDLEKYDGRFCCGERQGSIGECVLHTLVRQSQKIGADIIAKTA